MAPNAAAPPLLNKPIYTGWVDDGDYLETQGGSIKFMYEQKMVTVTLNDNLDKYGELHLNAWADSKSEQEKLRPVTIPVFVRRVTDILPTLAAALPSISLGSVYLTTKTDGTPQFPEFLSFYEDFGHYCTILAEQAKNGLSHKDNPLVAFGYLPTKIKRALARTMREIGVEGEIVLERYAGETATHRKQELQKDGNIGRDVRQDKLSHTHLHHGLSLIHAVFGYINSVAAAKKALAEFVGHDSTHLIYVPNPAQNNEAYTTPTSRFDPFLRRFLDLIMYQAWTGSPAAFIPWVFRQFDGYGTNDPLVPDVPLMSHAIVQPYVYWDRQA